MKTKKIEKFSIYIGFDVKNNDINYTSEECKNIVKAVCENHLLAYSINKTEGGYFYQDGNFIQEDSIMLTLIGTDCKMAYKVAKEIKNLLHQESILVVKEQVNSYYV